MLRRQVRKLVEALEDGLEAEEKDVRRIEFLAAKKGTITKKKRKDKNKAGTRDGVDGELLGEAFRADDDNDDGNEKGNKYVKDEFGIYERAVYLRGVLVPRAWL